MSIALRERTLIVDTVAIGQFGITVSAHRLGIAIVFEMRLVKSETRHKLQRRQRIDFPTHTEIHTEIVAAIDIFPIAIYKRRTVVGQEVLLFAATLVITVAAHITHITTYTKRLGLISYIEISTQHSGTSCTAISPGHHAATTRKHRCTQICRPLIIRIIETPENRVLVVLDKTVGHGIDFIHTVEFVHLSSSAGLCYSEPTLFHTFFYGKIYHRLLLAIIDPRETRFIRFAVYNLYLLDHISRQVFGSDFGIIGKELFPVDKNLFHLFSLYGNLSIFINFHTGQFLKHIFDDSVRLRLIRVGIIFKRIFLCDYRRNNSRNNSLTQQYSIGLHLYGTKSDRGLYP